MRRAKVWYSGALAGYVEETEEGYRFAYDAAYLNAAEALPVSQTLALYYKLMVLFWSSESHLTQPK